MKLTRKLVLLLWLGVFVVLAVHGYVRVIREVRLFETDMEHDSHIMGRVLAASVAEIWRSDGRERAIALVRDANERESQVTIRFVALDGATSEDPPMVPVGELLPVLRGENLVRKVPVPQEEDHLVTYIPVKLDGGPPGAIELAESLAGEETYIDRTILNTLLATLGTAIVCGAIASFVGVWLVGRPMKSLIEQARRIGAGDLALRLDVRQDDEVGELSREMNAMCERLAKAQQRIADETAARIGAIQQLRHADRLATVGKLASGIAHELGAPLQVVSGRARMIEDSDIVQDEVASNARIIYEQAQRIANIIRQLLDFARRRGAEKAATNLCELLSQTSAMLEPIAGKRGVSIEVERPEGEVITAIDAEQIKQALTNLIMNGIQAMSDGGRLVVGLQAEEVEPPADIGGPRDQYTCLFVEDEGEGIASDVIAHVFEPFYTTKDVGEGTGLGLAVAYGIVRDHGGWIDVRTEIKHGTRFSVYLPMSK